MPKGEGKHGEDVFNTIIGDQWQPVELEVLVTTEVFRADSTGGEVQFANTVEEWVRRVSKQEPVLNWWVDNKLPPNQH